MSARLGSALFFVLAPGIVAGLVPRLLSGWRMAPPLLGWPGFRILGVGLVAGGLAALVDSFARFAREGRGTPAPVLPTETLVVSGLYRHVRNPMYLAVLAVIVGQALLLGNPVLLRYAGAVFLAFYAFVLAYEEPTLRRSFGPSYAAYCRGVRRWWPRWSAWTIDEGERTGVEHGDPRRS